MTALASLVLFLLSLSQGVPAPPCAGASSAPALDHAILVVRDLELASAGFAKLGFRVKPGRLHSNNLLNRHVKFRDGSEIELMTVQGRPGDAMAKDYTDLLAAGEGGVYVALKVVDTAVPRRAAAALRLATRPSGSFLGFPPSSPAAAVFFTARASPARAADALTSHAPDVTGLAEVWVEGGGAMGELLARLGARRCGAAWSPDGRAGQRWALSRGNVVVVSARPSARPRLLGVVLRRRTPGEGTVYPHPRLWVRYRFEG